MAPTFSKEFYFFKKLFSNILKKMERKKEKNSQLRMKG